MKRRILVVDDEVKMQRILQILIQDLGHEAICADHGQAALAILQEGLVDLVITDLCMPKMDGIALLRAMREAGMDIPTIVMTAHGTVETAVEAMKLGAVDYLLRPFDLGAAELAVTRALGVARVKRENTVLRHELEQGWDEFIGTSPVMRALYADIDKMAPSRSAVLIFGETGTGKELAARSIHNRSGRAGLFIPVNCAAIPAGMLESEMFGHVKGAFTGANRERIGKFEAADGGTLFLDEIAEMPMELQAKLLRVLQENCVEPLGGNRRIDIDVRIVAATNREPRRAIGEGRLREDLMFRLDVLRVDMPPLRARREDIPLLVRHFLNKHAKLLGCVVPEPDEPTLNALMAYDWPGNVREVENIVERALVLGHGADVMRRMVGETNAVVTFPAAAIETGAPDTLLLQQRVAALEQDLIRTALAASNGNKARAARLLGVSERSLWYKLKRYAI